MEWKPIETAPKDGTLIIVFGSVECSARSRPHIGTESPVFAYWHAGAEGWAAEHLEGWVPEPSHWMPLPNPPVSE